MPGGRDYARGPEEPYDYEMNRGGGIASLRIHNLLTPRSGTHISSHLGAVHTHKITASHLAAAP
jgi:hypothetical protein